MTEDQNISIPQFFPMGVVQYFTTQRFGVEELLPQERLVATDYGDKRLADFCTGRYCMRQSTATLGFWGEILMGNKGMPLLPDHITASLSHSRHLCGAVAAPKDQYLSLGMDIETKGRVHRDMWHLLFSAKEIEYLNLLDAEMQSLTTTIFFSAKEAFYKMQFPLTDTYLDFHDVEMDVQDGRYSARLLKDSGAFNCGHSFDTDFYKYGSEIITFCAQPA
jgi:4'-phosphopantetheinyl transferase EntD